MLLKVPCDATVTPSSLKIYEWHAWYLEKSIQKGIRTQPPMTQKTMDAKKKSVCSYQVFWQIITATGSQKHKQPKVNM